MNPAVGAPKAGDVPGQRSPFQGLGFYTEDDAKWFFGRTVERKVILAHLRTAPLTVCSSVTISVPTLMRSTGTASFRTTGRSACSVMSRSSSACAAAPVARLRPATSPRIVVPTQVAVTPS